MTWRMGPVSDQLRKQGISDTLQGVALEME